MQLMYFSQYNVIILSWNINNKNIMKPYDNRNRKIPTFITEKRQQETVFKRMKVRSLHSFVRMLPIFRNDV